MKSAEPFKAPLVDSLSVRVVVDSVFDQFMPKAEHPLVKIAHVGRIRNRTYHFMHDSADDPLVDPPAAGTQEQRRGRMGTREGGTALLEPAV